MTLLVEGEPTARMRFPLGCKVRLTEAGKVSIKHPGRRALATTGTVVGYSPRDPWGYIAVVRDGCVSRHKYPVRYWEKVAD